MAHAVAAVAVVGKDNDPLFLQHFNDADELKFHYIVHTSLDIVEEKAASGKGGSSSAPSPALLTANIKNATALDELFRTVAAHVRHFNHIHLSACWGSLGQLARTADRAWVQSHAAALESLVQHTTRLVSTWHASSSPRDRKNVHSTPAMVVKTRSSSQRSKPS